MVATINAFKAKQENRGRLIDAARFQQVSEQFYCPNCEAVLGTCDVKHHVDPETGIRSTKAACRHCGTLMTAESKLLGGNWSVIDADASGPRGLVEKIADAMAVERAREIGDQLRDKGDVDRWIARTQRVLSRLFIARELLDAGQPLSADDRRDLDRLNADYDAAPMPATRTDSVATFGRDEPDALAPDATEPENGRDLTYVPADVEDQATRLRQLAGDTDVDANA